MGEKVDLITFNRAHGHAGMRFPSGKTCRFAPSWWHVSAYGDYALGVARTLG